MYIIYSNLTDDYTCTRDSQRARSPPRKLRVKSAIRHQCQEDVRRLLEIVTINEDAVECAHCKTPLVPTSIFEFKSLRFACQLCTKTCCVLCKNAVKLLGPTEYRAGLNAVVCPPCNDYILHIRSRVFKEPAEHEFHAILDDFERVIGIHKRISGLLYQLQGYQNLCSIHKQLDEPLPPGTTDKINELLLEVIQQRKLVTETKNALLDNTANAPKNSAICNSIKHSLLSLSKSILYQSIPKINEVIWNLERYGRGNS
uniref:FYVE-type domain-containing protein n=1 Tax=Babesia bovis TaxID=5865 RepID=S6B8Q7_BABBO|nr:hypothetical protein [Babesia bovis]